ncbi:MAG: OmpP1/FadL family transporter [Gammaproteobacteria bacterium]
MKLMLHRLRTTLCLAALLLPSLATAGGIWLYDLGAPSLGRAGAGSGASAEDAATAFTNPAGMALLEDSGLVAGVTGLFVSSKFKPGPGSTETGGGGGDAGGFSPAGGVYYANRHSDRTQWGLTLNSYFGLGLDYDNDWAGRYFAQEADIFTVAFTGTASRRLTDRISIGGGVSAVHGELTVKAALNNALDGLADGQIEINSDDVGFGFNAGIMFEILPQTRVGLTYRSEVELDLDDVLSVSGAGPTIQAALDSAGLTGSTVDLDVVIPQALSLAAYHRVSDRLEIMGDVGWQDWSEFGRMGINVSTNPPVSLTTPTRYDDTWRAAVGAEWELESRPWKLSAGIAYDSSPVSSADRTPEFPLDRQIRLGFGLHVRDGKYFDWSITYTYVDSGTGRMNASLGPLTGTIQGEYDPYRVHTIGFSIVR